MNAHSAIDPNEIYSPAEIRKILLELRYFYSVRELCAKWHITPYRLRQWRQAMRGEIMSGLHERVIVALHEEAHDVASIIAYLDYLDHAR